MCLSLLRITLLAMVLAVLPAKAPAFEAPFVEVPVLVLSAVKSQSADTQPDGVRRVRHSAFESVGTVASVPRQPIGEQRFLRVFRRFVVECSWLC